MATKKTSKATKKVPAKKTAAKKAPPTKGAQFHLYDEGQNKFIKAEQAKAVKVDGFDAFSFFLHKSADGKGWTISEASSGGRIAVGLTQKEAKAKAADALAKHGPAGLAESIRRSIEKNGAAPDYEAKTAQPKKPSPLRFKVSTDDGEVVEVIYDSTFRDHLEFRGAISSTGYRSTFEYDGKGEVEEEARKIANDLRAAFLKEQVKQARKGKKVEPSKIETLKPSDNRGRKPNGRKSQLDAAIEILKDAKEPLTCKEIVRRMFERKIWETSGRTPGATLSASMQRETAKRGKESRFRRAERGLYELNA
jgi:hypothetical protein